MTSPETSPSAPGTLCTLSSQEQCWPRSCPLTSLRVSPFEEHHKIVPGKWPWAHQHRKEAAEEGLPRVPLLSLAPLGTRLLFNSLLFPLFVAPDLERTMPASGASLRETGTSSCLQEHFRPLGRLPDNPAHSCPFHVASCPGH